MKTSVFPLPFERRAFQRALLANLTAWTLIITSAEAVQIVSSGSYSYNATDNISQSVTGWSSGWGSGGDGWNYVGELAGNDGSGVYLGNGWVLTCNHVGSGAFTLNGNTYNAAGPIQNTFTNSSGQVADLSLFKIQTISTTGTNLSLTPLMLMTATPAVNTAFVMFGYGYTNGLGPESWGTNSILIANHSLSLTGYPYTSQDFLTLNSGATYATGVDGDSGGGDFINVGTSGSPNWELAGINEATVSYGGDTTGTAFIQLSTYAPQIQAYVVPEPTSWGLLVAGVALMGFLIRQREQSD